MADRTWEFHWSDGSDPMELPEEALAGFDPGYSGVSHVQLADGTDLFIPWTGLRYVAAVPNSTREEVTTSNDGQDDDREAEGNRAGESEAPSGGSERKDREPAGIGEAG